MLKSFYLKSIASKKYILHEKTSKQTKRNYDPAEYLQAMKSFQDKTRGMLKNSNEWIKARNEAYKNLKDAHTAINTKREDYVTVDLDSFYINLIVIPEELECF